MSPEPPISDLSHLSEEEFVALCPQGEHAPGPEPLSPAAQAVFYAFNSQFDWIEDGVPGPQFKAIAAALRAAADQVVPLEQKTPWGSIVQSHAADLRIRNQFFTIATELEAQP